MILGWLECKTPGYMNYVYSLEGEVNSQDGQFCEMSKVCFLSGQVWPTDITLPLCVFEKTYCQVNSLLAKSNF
jgi:hypothetical protein